MSGDFSISKSIFFYSHRGSQGAGARFGAGASLRQGATINQFTGGAPGYGGASSAPQDVSQPSNDPWGQVMTEMIEI